MRFIYATDLHGNTTLYNKLLDKANDENIEHILIGGDMLPKKIKLLETALSVQNEYAEFLADLFRNYKKINPSKNICLIFGNDDLKAAYPVLKRAHEDKYIHLLNEGICRIKSNPEEISLVGYSYVSPTPFRLKDWEKGDLERLTETYYSDSIRSVPLKKEDFKSIAEDLENIAHLSDPARTIYLFHDPPYDTNLDILGDRTHTGSRAIRNFIENKKPFITLHGHIHESYDMSGKYSDKINDTLIINPGSTIGFNKKEGMLNAVIVDTEDLENIIFLTI
jgi:Icc-related predicted phosphoesterase